MEKFSQKYAIVQLLENKPVGYEFSSKNWPLHVTLADTFAVDWDKDDLLNRLTELLEQRKPTTAVGSHAEFFGPKKQTEVTVLEMRKELIALHYDIFELLESAGAVFNDPQYTKAGFRAHSTVQPHTRVKKGEVIHFKALSIIDMFPNKDPYTRKIVKTIELRGI